MRIQPSFLITVNKQNIDAFYISIIIFIFYNLILY